MANNSQVVFLNEGQLLAGQEPVCEIWHLILMVIYFKCVHERMCTHKIMVTHTHRLVVVSIIRVLSIAHNLPE